MACMIDMDDYQFNDVLVFLPGGGRRGGGGGYNKGRNDSRNYMGYSNDRNSRGSDRYSDNRNRDRSTSSYGGVSSPRNSSCELIEYK